MTTFGDLTDAIAASLHSYTGVQETYTWLTADCTNSATSMSVASSDAILRGVAEIGSELIFVDSADSGTLTLAPFGRGYRASTAVSHTANTQILFDPAFPRNEIQKRINKIVASLNPRLYQIKTTEFPSDGLTIGHTLPTDVSRVLAVSYFVTGDPYNWWTPIYQWRLDMVAHDGKVLNLFDATPASSTLRVVYQAPFGTLVNDSDTLASAGIPESYADLIEYGVTAHMIRYLDPARLQVSSVENVSRAQVVQVGDAGKVANSLYAMFQQRVSEERRSLLELNPQAMNFQR